MKTSVTEKESPGNLEEILRVKPKTEIIYQAVQYTGKNIPEIYKVFNERSMKFNVESGWNDNLILKITDRNTSYCLPVGSYIIFSYYSDRSAPDNVCIRAITPNLSDIQNKYKIIKFDNSMHNLSITPMDTKGLMALPLNWKTVNIFLDLFFTEGLNVELSTMVWNKFILKIYAVSSDPVKVEHNNYIVFRFRPDRTISIIEYNLSVAEFQERYEIIGKEVK
jgi:hypothetical protein